MVYSVASVGMNLHCTNCVEGVPHKGLLKFAKKVHKPPVWVNVIDFELNGLDASIWVP